MRKSLWKLLNLNCADRKNHISMYHIWSLYINKLKACENRGMVPRNTKHKAPSLCMSSQATGCLSDSSRSLTFHMLGEKLSAAIARSYPGWTVSFTDSFTHSDLLKCCSTHKTPTRRNRKGRKVGVISCIHWHYQASHERFHSVCFWVCDCAVLDNSVLGTPQSHRKELFQQEWLIFLSGISIYFLKHRI